MNILDELYEESNKFTPAFNLRDFEQDEIETWNAIVNAIKYNFVLKPTIDDKFLAKKSIEGIKTLPHLVIMFLCKTHDVSDRLMIINMNLTEKKYNEFEKRLQSGIHKNEPNLLRKIRLCQRYLTEAKRKRR